MSIKVETGKVTPQVSNVKESEEFKQYEALKTKFAAIEAAEAKAREEAEKLAKGALPFMKRSLRALIVSAEGNPKLMEALKEGLLIAVGGSITINDTKHTLSKEYSVTVSVK